MTDFSQYAPQQGFLIQGDDATFDRLVAEAMQTDPFVQAMSVPRFTVDHAKVVAEFATEGSGEVRMCIVQFAVFSPDAAQILLKSLEEPAPRTITIFITRYPYLVPQTVRSRLLLIESKKSKVESRSKKAILQEIKKEATEKEDDAATRRARATMLLDELELSLQNKAHSETGSRYKDIEQIYCVKEMLFRANLPTKYILDYIATVIR